MNKKLVAIIVAVLVVGGIAAVALMQKDTVEQKSSGNTSSDSTSESNTSGNNATETVATSAVAIDGFAFTPQAITVKKGSTVVWTNKDSTQHTVTGSNGGPKSDTLNPSDTYSFTFNTVGTFAYHCSFHSDMTGTVVVTE